MVESVTKCNKGSTKRKELMMTRHNKIELIKAMVESLGNITAACRKVGISRVSYFRYFNDDKKFRTQIEDIPEMRKDFVENKLNKLIKAENPTAIIFYLKTQCKDRGYIEKQEIEYSGDLNISHSMVDRFNESLTDARIQERRDKKTLLSAETKKPKKLPDKKLKRGA